ncbi:hypothetical protein T4A_7240 [Trichinella pseudospiralis]|uniref:Uncharacterized protein n=1 Tax=Trichinella pseudospiralis TaxID=6337 RepID=A0A0V1EEM6_TRIPS|nr:hypothetical protein T4A_7240 [Trichinella pseudospiralis]
MKGMHSKTCLPENVCKFLFHCYTCAYVGLDLMLGGVRCTGNVQCRGIGKLNDAEKAISLCLEGFSKPFIHTYIHVCM